MTAYQKAKGLLQGRGLRLEITLLQHYTKRNQHGRGTKHGTDKSTKGKKVETTIHHAKQPQPSVRVSMIESLNEEMEIKLSSLSVFCSSFQTLAAAN